MKLIGAIVGGLLGAVVGVAACAGIAFATGWGYGALAVVVGFCVGLGVSIGSRAADGGTGLIAAGLAVVGSVAAIWVANWIVIDKAIQREQVAFDAVMASLDDEEYVISFVADEVVDEFEATGIRVTFPAGVERDAAAAAEDYPTRVWAQALKRWNAMDRAEQNEFRTSIAEASTVSLDTEKARLGLAGFLGSRAWWDWLLVAFAAFIAFAMGRSTATVDPDLTFRDTASDTDAPAVEAPGADGPVANDGAPALMNLAREQRAAEHGPEADVPTAVPGMGPAGTAPPPPEEEDHGPGAFFNLMQKKADGEDEAAA